MHLSEFLLRTLLIDSPLMWIFYASSFYLISQVGACTRGSRCHGEANNNPSIKRKQQCLNFGSGHWLTSRCLCFHYSSGSHGPRGKHKMLWSHNPFMTFFFQFILYLYLVCFSLLAMFHQEFTDWTKWTTQVTLKWRGSVWLCNHYWGFNWISEIV